MIPVVGKYYMSQQDAMIYSILESGQIIDVCGDGRSDYPSENNVIDKLLVKSQDFVIHSTAS